MLSLHRRLSIHHHHHYQQCPQWCQVPGYTLHRQPRKARHTFAALHGPYVEVIEHGEHAIHGRVNELPCTLHAAVKELAASSHQHTAALIQLGAVYVGEPIKGQGTIKWRRVTEDLLSKPHEPEQLQPGSGRAQRRPQRRQPLLLPPGSLSVSSDESSDVAIGIPEMHPADASGLGKCVVAAGTLLRVHPRPKRFPACHTTDWARAVVFQDPDYVIINKPGGLPCMRHESNAREEVAGCVSRALGLGPLEVCHRLDQWTTGLLVLSRNKEAGAQFKRLLELKSSYDPQAQQQVSASSSEEAGGRDLTSAASSEGSSLTGAVSSGGSSLTSAASAEGSSFAGAVAADQRRQPSIPVHVSCGAEPEGAAVLPGAPLHKVYKALTHRPVPLGPLTHFMYDGPFNDSTAVLTGGCLPARGPRLLSPHPHPGWRRCSLQVMECSPAPPSVTAWLERSGLAAGHGQAGEGQGACAASLPEPAAPPPLYQSSVLLITGRTHQIRAQFAALGCPLVGDVMYSAIAGVLVGESGQVTDQDLVDHIERLPVLDGPLGLHAAQLTWGSRVLRAPAPWEGADEA